MSLSAQVNSLAIRIATQFNTVMSYIGDKSTLTTTTKSSLVSAINEVNGKTTTVPNATDLAAGIVELATAAETLTGTSGVLAVTPAGVKAVRDALKAEILGSAGAAEDTLGELKAYVDALDSADEGQIQGVITALAARVRVDVANQGLTTTQQANARTNIDVYSKTEIGSPETDFVASFNAALA